MATPSNAPSLSVHVGGTLSLEGADVKPVLLKVHTPKSETRAPSDIVVVIDVSVSMSSHALIKCEGGAVEGHGLTLLDIAVHGVNTIIGTLGAEDRLSIVMFNHFAEILLELTAMDEAGQKKAKETVEALKADGGTNIWAGLKEAMESLKNGASERGARLGHIMLLTDGYTSGREHVMENLEDYRERHERLPGTVSTFGFGYQIDSGLLTDIANCGNGTYSFIPDPGFVGTVFINTLSNLLCTFAREAWVSVDAEDAQGGKIVGVMGIGERQIPASGKSARIRLGTLQYEQPRSVVLLVDVGFTGALFAAVSYALGAEANAEATLECTISGLTTLEDKIVEPEYYRCLFTEKVSDSVTKLSSASASSLELQLEAAASEIRALAADVEGSSAAGEPFLAALVEDLRGQSLEAFSKVEWYKKWGVHYMPSIVFAHALQQCNNFKDPSVQLFGGDLFREIQELADEIFDKLPPPKPKPRAQAAPAAPAPVSMAAYNNRYGFCIDAASLVKLADGPGCRAVGELRKGDRIEALGGGVGEVVCLVRTACADGTASMVELEPGVRVTPYHPILSCGQWRFPVELGRVEERPCTAVCSLVLSGSPAVGLVSDGEKPLGGPMIFAAALGHGLQQDGAIAHPYFGGPRVLEDLRGAPGFDGGLVEIEPGNVVRDPETGLVSCLAF